MSIVEIVSPFSNASPTSWHAWSYGAAAQIA
jgi:hypothetical protein